MSIIRTNLLTKQGYFPYCGRYDCFARTIWGNDIRQFKCECGWVSEFPKDFIDEYVTFRVNSQVCIKCGVVCGNNKMKYCKDDNSHKWKLPSIWLCD